MPPTVYPTGTTIYDPDKCWNGFTVFQANDVGATVIDMNGIVINQWRGMTAEFSPKKILPGGYIMGNTGIRNPKYGFQDATDLVQIDWDGNVVWKFDRYERVKDPRQKPVWMVRHLMITRGRVILWDTTFRAWNPVLSKVIPLSSVIKTCVIPRYRKKYSWTTR